MLQNSKICAFSQFQSNSGSQMQQKGQKMGQLSRIQETVSNPIKLNCQNRLQIENIMVSDCELIVNYPESQQHTYTIEGEQNCEDQANKEQEVEPECNNCIDIESIMNPNYTDKFIAYNVTNTIEINQKGAKLVVPKELEMQQFKERDQTKNIPKNFIKAMFAFILENPAMIKIMLSKKRNQLSSCDLNGFLEYVRQERKNKSYTIRRLKDIWLDESYGKIMRILYSYFLRRRSLHYIYSSKIENKAGHIKYRWRMLESLKNPVEFNNFK